MTEETIRVLIVALLGTGGAAFIWAVARSVLAFRDSAEGREDKAIARLERYEIDAREQLALERRWGAYWQRRAATLDYVLRMNGIESPPAEPEPTGERKGS